MKCFGGGDVADRLLHRRVPGQRPAARRPCTCREFDDSPAPGGKRSYCVPRGFCDRCQHDGQCAGGGKCVKQGKETFCTLPCHAGSTECPRIADCQDVGGGDFQCVHRAAAASATGKMCQPCIDESGLQDRARSA